MQARTFHSAALRQARYFWPQVFGGDLPELISSKLSLLADATNRNRLKASQADLRDLASEIEWAKVSNVRPDDYARVAAARGRAVEGYDASTVAKVYASYEEVKRDRNRMDMEDALLYAAAVLDADERVASAVRKQYQWFVVDEFQDVSPLAVPVASAVAGRARPGVRRRRPRADHLHLRRGLGRSPARLPAHLRRHHLDHPCTATTDRHRRSSRPPTP